MASDGYPLAFNQHGDPIEVPKGVTGWRVKRLPRRVGGKDKGGAPAVVYGDDGRPLVIPVNATGEDLRQAAGGGGRYRLEAVDDDSKPFGGIVAVAELGGPLPEEEAGGLSEQVVTLLKSQHETIRSLAETLAQCNITLAGGYGKVKPVKESKPFNADGAITTTAEEMEDEGPAWAVHLVNRLGDIADKVAPLVTSHVLSEKTKKAEAEAAERAKGNGANGAQK